MSNYKGLRRFYLIIEKLKDGKNVSFKDISNHLDKHDVVISERTLQRDIAQIRSDFSIDIVYDKAKRCYFIDESTSIDLPNFYRFLELTLTTELLKDHQKEKRNVLRYIQFEPIESLRGHDNMLRRMKKLDGIILSLDNMIQ